VEVRGLGEERNSNPYLSLKRVCQIFNVVSSPHPADLIATLAEATAAPYFIYRLRDAMLSDPTGRRILRDRPRMTSETLPLEYLRGLPANSVGRTYAAWLDREGVSPDTRDSVKYIDDEECAYVMQRYRESHDFYHTVTGLPVMVEGEIALKAFEFVNTLIPMTGLSLFAIMRLKPEERTRFWNFHLPWAVKSGLASKELINVYWEEQLDRDVDELRKELNIEKPPDLREIRRAMRAQRKAETEARMHA
jgi:ubiquinone biosynthesis protein COQ4